MWFFCLVYFCENILYSSLCILFFVESFLCFSVYIFVCSLLIQLFLYYFCYMCLLCEYSRGVFLGYFGP